MHIENETYGQIEEPLRSYSDWNFFFFILLHMHSPIVVHQSYLAVRYVNSAILQQH